MTTAYISHPDCLQHDTGIGHPENARRLSAIEDRLIASGLMDLLLRVDAPEATTEQLLRVHEAGYLDSVEQFFPLQGHAHLDPDTVISTGSLTAARRAAGAVVAAVDRIICGDVPNAFCAVRPPGHHAESARAMGFCIYNNIAVGAAHALEAHGLQRVAILDFDVHQGNGTEQIFMHDDRVLFCSTFQYPFYPGTPLLEPGGTMISVPLKFGAGGDEFRGAIRDLWLPALNRFSPQMIFVSAGYDAHADDDMSGVGLTDGDFSWVGEQIMRVSRDSADSRVIFALEGGYELGSLARCVENHIRMLMGLI